MKSKVQKCVVMVVMICLAIISVSFKVTETAYANEPTVSVSDNQETEMVYAIPVKKNVISTLEKLKEAGCDLNILTASPHAMLDVCLKRLGIYDLFTNVWSCDDFSTILLCDLQTAAKNKEYN